MWWHRFPSVPIGIRGSGTNELRNQERGAFKPPFHRFPPFFLKGTDETGTDEKIGNSRLPMGLLQGHRFPCWF